MTDYATSEVVSSMGDQLERDFGHEITRLEDRIASLEEAIKHTTCPRDCGCDHNPAYLRGLEVGEQMQRETPGGRA